jgi:hypothetical protein
MENQQDTYTLVAHKPASNYSEGWGYHLEYAGDFVELTTPDVQLIINALAGVFKNGINLLNITLMDGTYLGEKYFLLHSECQDIFKKADKIAIEWIAAQKLREEQEKQLKQAAHEKRKLEEEFKKYQELEAKFKNQKP